MPPGGAGVDLAAPRWRRGCSPAPVAHLLDEAHAVGLTGRDALSTPARVLLADGDESAAAAMTAALPPAIDYFLVQADLTRSSSPARWNANSPTNWLRWRLSNPPGRRWSTGSASSRSGTPDVGRTAEALQRFFEKHSRKPRAAGTHLPDQ